MSHLEDNDNIGEETYHSAYGNGPPYISYGFPFPIACSRHVENTFKASRVYLIVSGSLSRNTDYVKQLQDALGSKVVGTRYGMTQHTLWSEILEVTKAAREANADLLITLGAVTLTDGAKIVATAMANDAETFEDLDELHSGDDWGRQRDDVKKPTVPIISIPTTLSGGEYSFLGGGTNDKTQQKHGFGHPTKGPELVILDPLLTTSTPDHVWLQSGVRAIDHCVEGMCSLQSTPESDADAGKGLQLLVPGLLKCKKNKRDVEARLKCQMGVIESMKVVFQHNIPQGASHGIGHQLGPLGVGHGETSCILLPAVCKYNEPVNADQQRRVRSILWADEEVAAVLESKGLSWDTSDLGEMLHVIISELGMPRSLKAVGVGDEKLDKLAEHALHDKWCRTNPRPLTEKPQVMEILQMVRE